MTGNPDTSLTIDTHHHILPDFFWQETENAHAPVGGLAPLRWSKEATTSFMDDAGIDVAVVSLSTPDGPNNAVPWFAPNVPAANTNGMF
jgi:hypothetical protein